MHIYKVVISYLDIVLIKMKRQRRQPAASSEYEDAPPSKRPQGSNGSCTVLLMGETGSGKSTFINYLANYFLGGQLKAPKIVIPNPIYRNVTEQGYAFHNETNLDDRTVSQTRKCTTYTFRKGNATYNFIDTPGLSDTTNSAAHCVDNDTVNTILQAAGQVGELQAIILIINGTTARLTVNLQNALQRIAGNYPDVLLNNMVVVFTNTMGSSRNFDERSLVHRPAMIFNMNNAALSTYPGDWDEEDEEVQPVYWRTSMRTLNNIIDFVDQLAPQSTEVFRNMLASRHEINSELFRATKEIEKQQQFVEMLENLTKQIAEYEHKLNQDHIQMDLHNRDVEFHISQEKVHADARKVAEKSVKSISSKRSSAVSRYQYSASKLSSLQSQLAAASKLSTSYYMEYPKIDTSDCITLYVGWEAIEFEQQGYIQQKAEARQLEQEIADLADQSHTAQMEIQRYDSQLQSMATQANRCKKDEDNVRKLKNEALRKKQEIWQAIKAVEQEKKKSPVQTLGDPTRTSKRQTSAARCTEHCGEKVQRTQIYVLEVQLRGGTECDQSDAHAFPIYSEDRRGQTQR